MAATPFTARLLAQPAGEAQPGASSRHALLAALLALLCSAWLWQESTQVYPQPKLALDLDSSPVTRLDFMLASQLTGRVFATSRGASGYVSMRGAPALKTFADGRTPQLFPEGFEERALARAADAEGFAQLAAEHAFDYVVLAAGLMEPSNRAWGHKLEAAGTFVLIDFDEHGMLWARKAATHSGNVCADCPAFVALQPFRMGRDWASGVTSEHGSDRVIAEIEVLAARAHGRTLAGLAASALLEGATLTDPQRSQLAALAER
jgi:hypothetical protein